MGMNVTNQNIVTVIKPRRTRWMGVGRKIGSNAYLYTDGRIILK